MLSTKTATAVALALGLYAGAAWIGTAEAAGQSPSGQPTGTMQPSSPAPGQGQSMGTSGQHAQDFRAHADELVDRDIVNQRGDEVGELNDLVADQSGKLYGVVQVGDVAGIGGKNILIPVEQLQIGQDNLMLMSQDSEETLKQKPPYEEGKYKSILEKREGGTRSGEPKRTTE